MTPKKRYENNFFSPMSFIAVFGSEIQDLGSGMGKNQGPGSGINIPDPPHCGEEFHLLTGGSNRGDELAVSAPLPPCSLCTIL